LASEQETLATGTLLREIVTKIDFGRDLEQQLKILTQARGIFINFDQVTDILVLSHYTCRSKGPSAAPTPASDLSNTITLARHSASPRSHPRYFLDVHLLRRYHNPQSYESSGAVEALHSRVGVCAGEQLDFRDGLAVPELFEAHQEDALVPRYVDTAYPRASVPQTEPVFNKLFGLSIMIPGDPNVSGFKLLEETFDLLIGHKWQDRALTCREDATKAMKMRLLLNFLNCICTLLQNKLPYHAFKGIDELTE
jgi:hypothetical protein